MECQICLSSSSKVTCNKCDYKTCNACTKRVLEESINDAACCQCKEAWDDDFLINSLSKSWFLGDYRKSRTKVTVERQQGMMAATMPLVEIEQRKRKQAETIKELEQESREMRRKIKENSDQVYALRNRGESRPPPVVNVARFRCATPECRGFVSEPEPKCTVCEETTCLKCLCLKEESHECKPEDISTTKEILKSSKACPSCATRIQKSHGCDQMFCVLCHTAFSYLTGEIETRNIHNPHYYELQARMNRGIVRREPGDIACGGFPELYNTVLPEKQRHTHGGRIRICNHITEVELPKLRVRPDFNADTRVKFILKDIDEKTFMSQTNRKAMDERVNGHYYDILRAFVDATQDVYSRFAPTIRAPRGFIDPRIAPDVDDSEYVKELDEIINITNKASRKIGEKYNRSFPAVPTIYYRHMTMPELEWSKA
jgi:hypothetical protein